jgi:hypothetical protein
MPSSRPTHEVGWVLVLTLIICSATTGAAAPTAAATTGFDTTAPPTDAASDSASHRSTIEATFTFARTDDPGSIALELRYDLPPGVTAFRLALPGLARQPLSVARSEGFERVDGTTFAWTGLPSTPTLELRLAATDDELTPTRRALVRDGWAFATVPHTAWDVTYTGSRPRLTSTTDVSGAGYGADRMAFMGEYDLAEGTTGDEDVTFVLGNGTATANVSDARQYLERARGRFDFGVERDRLVVFVLPYEGKTPTTGERSVTGEAFGDAVWVTADATGVDGPSNAFAHEYVHSRLGTVGNGSAAWLTEATAEYYGSLSTLNVGGSSYAAFLDATRAPRFGPDRTAVVLAEPETWRGTLADYEKGAHVLAALDAEIRGRTNGERTLYDVFRSERSFDGYPAFRAAVVETSGDESLGEWLDRYVRTTALPPLPDDPATAVQGADLDPDGDGLTSGTEVDRSPSTHPFVADTDSDGLPDGVEVERGTNPAHVDTDGDGVNDASDPEPLDASVSGTPTNDTTAKGAAASSADAAESARSVDERRTTGTTGNGAVATDGAETAVETSGFGVGVAVATLTLWGMLCRREKRQSS